MKKGKKGKGTKRKTILNGKKKEREHSETNRKKGKMEKGKQEK